MAASVGQLVTEMFAYGGGRQVSAYVPTARPEVVLLAGDGQLIAPWGDFLNQHAGVPPTLIIAAHRLNDEMERLHEYSPGFDAERFAAHERFLVEDVRGWVQSRFGVELTPDRAATFGVSASGELALALGLRHPDLFGAILCASPGAGYQPPGDIRSTVPRAYLVSGTEEPFFQANAARWDVALRAAGADVVVTERPGSHGDPFWRDELPLMVSWAFG